MKPEWQELIDILRDTRTLLSRSENDFAWSSWEDAEEALQEIDALMVDIEDCRLLHQTHLKVLFAPTGPIQEVSLSRGWGDEFLLLAGRFDAAIARI